MFTGLLFRLRFFHSPRWPSRGEAPRAILSHDREGVVLFVERHTKNHRSLAVAAQ